MKRSLRITIFLVLLISLFMYGSAQAANVSSYTSAFQIQNLNPTDAANFIIKFYNRSDGSLAATTSTASIPGGGSASFFTLSAVDVGFDGSAVIESDQPVAAVSLLYGNVSEHMAEYTGFSAGATSVYIPLTQKNNYGVSTFINVQNTGSSDANVTINYAGTACSESVTIKPGAAKRFDQATNSCLTDGFRAATITSTNDQPVVAVVVQVNSNFSASLTAGLLASGGFVTGSTFPLMPLISTGWYGSTTSIQIQNTGTLSTDVTVSYSPTPGLPGASCTESKTIASGASKIFGMGTMPSSCKTVSGGYTAFVGSAKVTTNSASQPLVAVVTQTNNTNGQKAAYNAFDPSSATTSVSFPIVADRFNNSSSSISIVNLDSSTQVITCAYTDTVFTQSKSVVAGGTWTPQQNNKISAGYIGSGNCTSAGPIIGIANLVDQTKLTGPLDGLGEYEGINH
jgi:hypothetical protein